MDSTSKSKTSSKKQELSASEKGDQLVAQAQAKLQDPKGFFGSFKTTVSGPEVRKEDALNKLQEAINQFKIAKEWVKAGQAYLTIAKILPQLNAPQLKIATAHASAAHCFLKEPSGEAEGIKALTTAANIYSTEGDWAQAVNAQKQVAEYLEQHDATADQIAEAWLKVADLNEMDSSHALRNSCLNKVATIYGNQKKYLKAAELYEIIASTMVKDEMLKYGTREPWKNEGICRLALGDIVHVKKLNDKCLEQFPEYAETREYKLISALIRHAEDQDTQKFDEEVARFHKFTPFEPWQLEVLTEMSAQLEGGDEDAFV